MHVLHTRTHTLTHTHSDILGMVQASVSSERSIYTQTHTHTHSYILGIVEVSVSSAWRNSISWAVLDPGAAHMSRTCKERSQLKL